ncbi:solute carrier family 22 member 21-like isoform X2 [Mya arenaria]|uniref:solute carrier family 22 member 21-like isoform X2 n=1 Tax=Mya arenaria TaxID=6604 RepID=UPI0022E5042D|nr:solute carrier family 22 member 21-like isoform X2 [Mya arenaria]
MSAEKNADDLLLSIGGCGRYQWRLVVTLHLLQILVVFSLNSNIIISATKEWRCADETICGRIRNVSDFSNSTHGCPVKQCKFTLVDNETVECERFQFHDNTTFVAEDWRYILLMCALLGVPFLFTWRLIPESFRWYLAHDKIDKATAIIQSVADANGKQYPDLKDFNEINSGQTLRERKYTFWHLFKTRHLIRITLLLVVVWIGLGLISYGIMYGIQTLSGNIYLNLALFNIVPLPVVFLSNFLQNKVGRRITTSMCFLVVTVGGAIAASVQVFDAPHKGIVTLVAAMVANVGIGTAWGPVQTMTLELYPTVIRSIGYGSMNVVSKAGAILGPQLNYLNTFLSRISFLHLCGGGFHQHTVLPWSTRDKRFQP